MPRRPNQTDYDAMLNVFPRQPDSEPRRRHIRPQSRSTQDSGRETHPGRQSLVNTYTTYTEAYRTPSSLSSDNWPGNPSTDPANDIGYDQAFFGNNNRTSHTYGPQIPASTPGEQTGTWMFEFEGGRRVFVEAYREVLPQVQCDCYNLIRVLDVPTYARVSQGFRPSFGILWNQGEYGQYWSQGRITNHLTSVTECIACSTSVTATLQIL